MLIIFAIFYQISFIFIQITLIVFIFVTIIQLSILKVVNILLINCIVTLKIISKALFHILLLIKHLQLFRLSLIIVKILLKNLRLRILFSSPISIYFLQGFLLKNPIYITILFNPDYSSNIFLVVIFQKRYIFQRNNIQISLFFL